jgi:signal peptidase II
MPRFSLRQKWPLFATIAVVSLAADLLTKLWARAALPVSERGYGIAVPFIDNYWDWQLAYNTGSAFSMFDSVGAARLLLTLIGFVAIGGVLWMAKRTEEDNPLMIAALALIVGGAVGNLFDRLTMGKVTDFIVWRFYEHRWPIFNIADVVLVIGVLLVMLDSVRTSRAAKVLNDNA